MAGKAVISLSTGLEDPEKVAVAFLVAVGAAESGRPTLMFQTKEAVRLALDGSPSASPATHAQRCLTYSPGITSRAGGTWSARSASTPSTSTRAACCLTPNSPERSSCGNGSAMKARQRSATDQARAHQLLILSTAYGT
jgi:hypothetical protein